MEAENKIIRIGRQRSIEEVMKDLNELYSQGKLDQIHVVFKDNDGVNWLSSVGDWSGLCVAAVMMHDQAIRKGKNE